MSLPQASGTVLLTGANGFVASHILSGLIARGYQVVAAVPSEKTANEILKLHPTWEYDITFAYVPDITADNAYDEAFRLGNGADYVIHTASPLNSNVSDIQRDIIDPAIKGTTGLLACAQRAGGKRLKRFVLLGSAVAVLNSFDKMSRPGKPYTEADWNPITAKYAIDNKDNVAGYNASKKLTEQAAWKYMDDHKPSFDLTVLNPDIIIGPMVQHVPGPKNVNETNMVTIYNFLNGTYKSVEGLTFPFYHFVDVRDVAKAHILALTTPAASNKRIVLSSGVISPQLIINTIRDNFLELQDRIIEGDPDQWMPRGVDPTEWDTRRSREVFGPKWHYIRLEKSIIDTVESLLEFEKSW